MATRTITLVLLATLAVGCGREGDTPTAEELPTLDVTRWSERSELFMEHPPLVAGQPALFAVHLTRLSDFTALTEGRPSIEFTPESGGTPTTLRGNAPSRPGVFRVEGPPPAPGRYRWALLVEATSLTDRHDLGPIEVFATTAAAVAAAEAGSAADAAAISYLKEQQWTTPFATAVVAEAELRNSLRVPAVIEPLVGGEAVVTAPADGRFAADTLLGVGALVREGQVVGRLQPRLAEGVDDRATLAAGVAEAEAVAQGAREELARAERLLDARAVPARRVEEARRGVTIAEARLDAARARLAQRDETLGTGGGVAAGNAFSVRAPIAGRIAEVFAALGASYEEGAPLFRIVRTDRVELQAHVPPADASRLSDMTEVALELPGREEPLVVQVDHKHDAGVIDPRTHALPVQFHADNRAGQLLVGQTATAILYTGGAQRWPAVPRTAVLTEGGRPYVFVQTGGESFSRRFIDVAARDGSLVGVRAGVKAGERVVVTGGYDVQLASAAGGLPAEGHVH